MQKYKLLVCVVAHREIPNFHVLSLCLQDNPTELASACCAFACYVTTAHVVAACCRGSGLKAVKEEIVNHMFSYVCANT